MRIDFSPQQNTALTKTNLSNNNNKSAKDDDGQKKSISKTMKNGANSGKTKKKSALEILMEQKSNLEDSKNAIISQGLKDGESAVSIKQKTGDIDKQIEEIDNQISKLQLEEKRKALGSEEKDKNKKPKSEASNNESESDLKKTSSLDSIVDISTGLKNFQKLSHIRNTIKGNIKELEGDIEYDIKFLHIDPAASKKTLAKMQESINNVEEKISESLKNIKNKTEKNIKEQTSKTSVHSSEKSNQVTSGANSEDVNKLSIAQHKVEENIKQYVDNGKDKSKSTGEKIDNIA
jgi:hypothetical protein